MLPVIVDLTARRCWKGEEEIILSGTEYCFLEYLAIHQGQILTREMILERIWGSAEYSQQQIWTTVGRLRKKLGDTRKDYIQVRRGLGYLAGNMIQVKAS